jgi:HK97 family phage portal protein
VSLFHRARRLAPAASALNGGNTLLPFSKAGSVRITNDTALRASAVWAALRLRANLVSSLPVDAFRERDGIELQVPAPSVTWSSGGRVVDWGAALYMTQFDLDRAGNAFGVITEVNGLGLPARIELVNLADVALTLQKGQVVYNIGGTVYQPDQVWHEVQYPVAGLALGLSPIAHAISSIGAYLSAQDFALDWFGSSAMPAAVLQNTQQTIPPDQAAIVKARAQAAMTPGGVFVTGSDWELKPINAVNNQNAYVELMQFGVPDIARFFDVPADLIDGAIPGSSVTYANIAQRNLQLLLMHVGPAVTRRENALSNLLPRPRRVKLNRDALLAMDPQTRTSTLAAQINARIRTVDEVRALENLPPLTPEQVVEFDRLFGGAGTSPVPVTEG